MNTFFYFFLIIIFFHENLTLIIQESNAGVRVVKLADFVENGSYLPVKSGEDFIIEIEGNPSTGYKWALENAEVVAKNKVLFPLNLDTNGSGLFYNSNKEKSMLNGIYHFHFNTKKQGNEKLIFSYYKESQQSIKKTIEIHVRDVKKDL